MPQRKSENKDIHIAMTVLILFITIMFSNAIVKFVSAHSDLLSFIAFMGIVISFLIIVLSRLSPENNSDTSNLRLIPIRKSKKSSVSDFDFLNELEIDEALPDMELEEPLPEIKPTEWTKDLISSLDWKHFEQLCSEYLTLSGCQSELTKCGADGGVDVRIFKDNNLYAVVQCKAQKKDINVKSVRELLGVMTSEYAARAIFITSGSFTEPANNFGDKNKQMTLVSGDKLFQHIKKLSKSDQKKLLDSITSGDYLTPTCPNCDVKMTLRTATKGSNKGNNFWGCVNYPKCKRIINL